MARMRIGRSALLLFGILLLTGCASKPAGTDLVSSGRLRLDPVPSKEADVPPPSVVMADDVMQIRGVVRRKADYEGPLDGHVKIELISPTKEVLAQFPIDWEPSNVPVTGNREAEYSLNYGFVPPEGTVLRVSLVEDDVEGVSISGGGDSKGPKTAGNPKGAPSGIRTPSPTGHPKNGYAPGTPGTPGQRSSSPGTPGASRGRGRR